MGIHSQMTSAISLTDQLDEYVMSDEFHFRYQYSLATVMDELDAGASSRGVTPEDIETSATNIVIDTMLFERSNPGERTLAERYLAEAPSLTIAERKVLAGWRDGGVLGVFEILAVRDAEQEVVARHLGNGRQYRLFLATDDYVDAPRMRPGNLLSGRALPVGATWLLSGTIHFWFQAPADGVMDVVRNYAHLSPSSMFHVPALLERGRKLVATQHETFLSLFGANVVEGSAAETYEAAEHFLAELGWEPESDWAPVKYTLYRMAELQVVAELTDDAVGRAADSEVGHEVGNAIDRAVYGRADDRPDDPTGAETSSLSDDEPLYALAHHPVGGLRIVGGDYQLAETAHRSAGVAARFAGAAMRRMIERSDLPWFVLRDLADRYPDRAQELYRAALRRPDFDIDTDLDQVLREREPGASPERPGITLLPGESDLVRQNRRWEAA